MALIGEQLSSPEVDLCGVVLSSRPAYDTIQIWNGRPLNPTILKQVTDQIRSILQCPNQLPIEYHLHKETIEFHNKFSPLRRVHSDINNGYKHSFRSRSKSPRNSSKFKRPVNRRIYSEDQITVSKEFYETVLKEKVKDDYNPSEDEVKNSSTTTVDIKNSSTVKNSSTTNTAVKNTSTVKNSIVEKSAIVEKKPVVQKHCTVKKGWTDNKLKNILKFVSNFMILLIAVVFLVSYSKESFQYVENL